ncbi:MAG TPA: DUF5703 domain-containing protein [Chthonomonadales bacterium]|nr:DUF5703 domain-containing protein [Chthonomonadales bacterium]
MNGNTTAGPVLAAFSGSAVSVDYASYVTQHDVVYRTPPAHGRDAALLGDGDLGLLVWCPDGELRIQINKADLWWMNPHAASPRPDDCQLLSAGVLRVVSDPSPLSDPQPFRQMLSLYSASCTVQAASREASCRARVWVAATAGVACVEYQDVMVRPRERFVELSAWREGRAFALGDTFGVLEVAGDRRFAVACRIAGLSHRATLKDSRTARAELPLTRSCTLRIFVAVAATEREADPISIARSHLDSAVRIGHEELARGHKAHWRSFWRKSFLSVRAEGDASARHMEGLWYTHRYLMACSSRGRYAPPALGSLWAAGPGERPRGAGYTPLEMQAAYLPLFAANHLELVHTLTETYARMRPVVERDTAERLSLPGACFTSLMAPDGRSLDAPGASEPLRYAPCIAPALAFWWCWQHARDPAFLRTRAYPFLRSCIGFCYEHARMAGRLPATDEPANALAPEDAAALRWGLLALAEASEELGVDAATRPTWIEVALRLEAACIVNEAWRTGTPAGVFFGKDMPPTGLAGASAGLGADAPRDTGRLMAPIAAARSGAGAWALHLLVRDMATGQTLPQCLYTAGGAEAGAAAVPECAPLGVLSATLNEMCLQERGGAIHLFPALPPGWDGTYALRSPGGLSVMAECVGGVVLWAAVHSYSGGTCRIANPWAEQARVMFGKEEVCRTDGPVIEFEARRAGVYALDRPRVPLARMLRWRLSALRPPAPRSSGAARVGPAPVVRKVA